MAKTKVEIPSPEIKTMTVEIVGISSLIFHKFGAKARRQIEDKQQQRATTGRGKREPKEEFESSLYPIEVEGKKLKLYGFPATGFKKAMVRAGSLLGMKMTQLRCMFFVMADSDTGDLVIIDGEPPEMRTDVVRLPNKSADIRYRGEMKDWSATLCIKYNTRIISDEQLINILATAGFSVGVGEWRPEKDGTHGMFQIKENA
jgi:hypothetical protein